MRIEAVLGKPSLGCSEVLGDVDGSAVRTEQELAVKAVGGEVAPDRAVGFTDENAHIQALLYQLLPEKISLALEINLVEGDPEGGVGLVKTVEHPFVHPLPEVADLRVAGLPLAEHLMGLLEAGSLFLGGLLIHSPGHKSLNFFL